MLGGERQIAAGGARDVHTVHPGVTGEDDVEEEAEGPPLLLHADDLRLRQRQAPEHAGQATHGRAPPVGRGRRSDRRVRPWRAVPSSGPAGRSARRCRHPPGRPRRSARRRTGASRPSAPFRARAPPSRGRPTPRSRSDGPSRRAPARATTPRSGRTRWPPTASWSHGPGRRRGGLDGRSCWRSSRCLSGFSRTCGPPPGRNGPATWPPRRARSR